MKFEGNEYEAEDILLNPISERGIIRLERLFERQTGYAKAAELEREINYMKRLYPAPVKELAGKVSDALDVVDNERSFIYDKYPDIVSLRLLLSRIKKSIGEQTDTEGYLTELLFYQEIYMRRQRNNLEKRWL